MFTASRVSFNSRVVGLYQPTVPAGTAQKASYATRRIPHPLLNGPSPGLYSAYNVERSKSDLFDRFQPIGHKHLDAAIRNCFIEQKLQKRNSESNESRNSIPNQFTEGIATESMHKPCLPYRPQKRLRSDSRMAIPAIG